MFHLSVYRCSTFQFRYLFRYHISVSCTQQIFTCSESTIETLEKVWTKFKVNEDIRARYWCFSGVFVEYISQLRQVLTWLTLSMYLFSVQLFTAKKCPYWELSWSVFSRIRTEYGEIRSISLYTVRIRENKDQNNSEASLIICIYYLVSILFPVHYLKMVTRKCSKNVSIFLQNIVVISSTI